MKYREEVMNISMNILSKCSDYKDIVLIFENEKTNLLSKDIYISTISMFNIISNEDFKKIITIFKNINIYDIMLPLFKSSHCFNSYDINYILFIFSRIYSTECDLSMIIDSILKSKTDITNINSLISLSISIFSLIFVDNKIKMDKIENVINYCNDQFNTNNYVIILSHFYMLLLPFQIPNICSLLIDNIIQKIMIYLLNESFSKYIIKLLQLFFIFNYQFSINYCDIIRLGIKDGFHNSSKNININMSNIYPFIVSLINKYGNSDQIKEIFDYLKGDILSLKNDYTIDPLLNLLTFQQYEFYIYSSIQSIKYITSSDYAETIIYDILLPTLVNPSNDIKYYSLKTILYLIPFISIQEQYNVIASILPFMFCSYENLRNEVDINVINEKHISIIDYYLDKYKNIINSIKDMECKNIQEILNIISPRYTLKSIINIENNDKIKMKHISDVNKENWDKIMKILHEKYKNIKYDDNKIEKIEYYLQKLRTQKGFKGATTVVISHIRCEYFNLRLLNIDSITNLINEIYGEIKKTNYTSLTWDVKGYLFGFSLLLDLNNNDILLFSKNLYNLVTTVYIINLLDNKWWFILLFRIFKCSS